MSLSKAFAAVTLVVVALTVRASAQTAGAGPFVAGEILVKFTPGVNADARADAHRVAAGTPLIEIQRTGVQRVRVTAGNETAAIARYQLNPNVLYAEPNFIRSIPTPTAHAAGSEVVPGDYYFDEQWALHNTGQSFYCIPWISGELCLYSGTPDADIDAPEAWAIFTGSFAVTVAVIDSGIDYTHPDLAANYVGGDDFIFFDGDPMDDHGHGTHVAGTIAAALDNLTGTPAEAEGVAGVAPNARIRAYKVCRSDGTCDDFAIQQAIARAITDGANVINMSLGESAYSQSLDDAVQDAWNAGLVIVAGAGNDGTTDPFYPAALDNVISVAAFDEDHRRPSFSNYGSWVDISAPGNVIMSTYPLAACGSSTTPGDTGCYTWSTGTSMATPHVSGAAALVWSRSDVTSNSQVVDILLSSADGKGVAPGRLDSWTVHGGLNLHDAVSYGLTNLPPLADAGPDQTVTDSGGDGTEMVTLDGSASSDRDGSIVSYAWREASTSIAVEATADVWLPVGIHTLTLEVTDDDGATATDSVVVAVDPPGNFSLSAAPGSMSLMRGSSGTSTITITPQDGFTGTVTLSASGLPTGVTASFSPNPAATNSSTLTLTASSTATTGTVAVALTGTSGSLTNSTTLALTVSVAPNPSFPSSWFNQDIGAVGVTGSASYADGVVTVQASGQEVWNTADGLHYVYQPLSGDGTIVARVGSLTGGSSTQSAGVMIRETLDASSKHAYAAFSQSQIYFTNRTTTGGSTAAQSVTGKALPYWVKLTRSGDTFTASASGDGVSWVQIGAPQTISMTAAVYVGLAVSSGQNSTLATATFDHVSLSTPAAPAPILSSLSPVSGPVGTQVLLSGSGFGPAQGTSVVRLNGALVTVNSWSDTSITVTIPSGATSGPLAVAVAPSMNTSNPLTFTVSTLPAHWLDQDIGAVGVAGGASYADGVFTVQASGQQVWNTADGLHYVYQPLSGDGTIVARVGSLTGGSSTQSAGVMIRETLDASSKHAYAAFSQSQIYFTNRTTTGGSTAAQSVTGKALPYWVKLTRSGDTFTASASGDGVSWVQIGVPQTISMTAAVYVGLVVSSGENSTLATGTFDNVSMTPGVPSAASFSLSAAPGSMSLMRGSSGTSTITITPQDGFTGTVTLSASGLPTGVTASFSPNPATNTSNLTLTASSTATTGTVSVALIGTSGSLTNSTTLALTVSVAPNPTFPSSWFNQDIGSVGVAGSASYADGVFTVQASGQWIWNTADGMHFVYQSLSGDGTIVARVGSLAGGSSTQSAGVMIRETLDASSKHAYAAFSQSQIYFTHRTTTGGSTSAQSLTGKALPYWVKLTRSGNTFTAHASPDGVSWGQIGAPQTISMTAEVYVGLAASSGENSTLATATFDHVSLSTPAAPAPILSTLSPASGAIGTQVLLSGSGFGASQDNSVVRLNGALVTVNSWSDTSITVTIPSGATSGPLAVSVAPSMNNSNPLTFTVPMLPAPWLDQDIGSVGVAGGASYADGVFTVQASGQWIWNTADGMHFVYQSLSGDGTIVARVGSLAGGSSTQSAGVMIRETLDASSKHAYAAFSQSQIYFTHRTTTGGSTSAQSLTGKALPYWVKLTRSGNTFTAHAAPDGVSWGQIGAPQTISMTAAVYVGLAVSSGQNSTLATATFDNLSISIP